MNILNNKNKRTSIFKALALCLFAAVSLTLISCDDDMDIQQSYPCLLYTSFFCWVLMAYPITLR